MAVLYSKVLREAGFAHALPERDVPDPELLAALGAARVVQVKQVHGAAVSEAGEATDATGGEADALVARAREGRIAVGVRVADCVPVLLADATTGDVAAIHAGWRGVVAGVVGAAVGRLAGPALPAVAKSMVAAIGPCIGACCCEVGRDVADAIARASHGAPVVVHARADKAYVDLRAAVRAQLRAAGLRDARIEDVPGCTKHDERFHSFRRDGQGSGRMLAAVVTR
jgi:polyphenol oxidase